MRSLLVFLLSAFLAATYAMSPNDRFLDELDTKMIPGAGQLDSSSMYYRRELKHFVDMSGSYFTDVSDACYHYLIQNLSTHDARLLADLVNEQDTIVLMRHEELKEFYHKIMEQLLEDAEDDVTIDNIEVCKYVISKRQIKSFRNFFEWMDEERVDEGIQEEIIDYYKKGRWDELISTISDDLTRMYYAKSDLMQRHSMILRKLCTGSAMMVLKTPEAQEIFEKLYENHYYRGAYEWVTWNANVSSHHNWHHIQHAYRVCLKFESYAPLSMSQDEERDTQMEIRNLIRQKMDTPELKNKLNLQHLLDSMFAYLQETPLNETTEFVESFAKYCDRKVNERNKIVRYSSYFLTAHKEQSAFTETKCLSDLAHKDFNKKVTNSASELMHKLEPYCHYAIELACASKFGAEFINHNWFARPFTDDDYNQDWPKYKPWDTKHTWEIQRLVKLAKTLSIKQ